MLVAGKSRRGSVCRPPGKEAPVTERDMPPAERPTRSHREGEQEHLREDVGMTREAMTGEEPAGHLRKDAGQPERQGEEKGLIDKAKDRLKKQ